MFLVVGETNKEVVIGWITMLCAKCHHGMAQTHKTWKGLVEQSVLFYKHL